MSGENRCPTCGAPLRAGQACPFCAEARRLLTQLAEQEDVRLCARCGAVLQPAEEEVCDNCRRALRARVLPARREDRVARWIRDQFVEPPAERAGLACPSCGQSMPPLALFCPHCGHKVSQAQASPAAPSLLRAAGEAVAITPPVSVTASGEAPTGVVEPTADLGNAPVAEAGTVEEVAASPSFLARARSFLQDQFHPFVEEWRSSPQVPFGTRVRALLRNLFGPRRSTGGFPTWLWTMFILVLAGLVGMVIFWAYLLSSGVRFR